MEESRKVLCIGSAVLDIMASPIGKKEEWKEKQRISSICIQVGGDAVNQSIRLADVGVKSSLLACIGKDDNGQMLKSALKSRGVDTSLLSVRTEADTGTAIVLVDEEGERHTFSVKGAYTLLGKEDCIAVFSQHWDAISLASLFSMPVLEKDGMLKLLQQAKEKKIPIFADLSSDKQKQGLPGIVPFLPYIDWFMPSLYDALEMTGTDSAEDAANVYHQKGAIGVIIKCGSRGCYFSTPAEQGWVSALPVRTVDTTGAGDCMAALFISRMIRQDSVQMAIEYACVGASYSTQFYGASAEPVTDAVIRRYL